VRHAVRAAARQKDWSSPFFSVCGIADTHTCAWQDLCAHACVCVACGSRSVSSTVIASRPLRSDVDGVGNRLMCDVGRMLGSRMCASRVSERWSTRHPGAWSTGGGRGRTRRPRAPLSAAVDSHEPHAGEGLPKSTYRDLVMDQRPNQITIIDRQYTGVDDLFDRRSTNKTSRGQRPKITSRAHKHGRSPPAREWSVSRRPFESIATE
jgi:hypothetical protein